MKSFLSSKKTYVAIRICLGGLFILSGGIKMMDLQGFSKVVEAFAILPAQVSYPAAVITTGAELIFGTLLVFDVKGGLAGITGLLLIFVLVLSWAIHMGYDIDCGCFGPNDPEAKAFSGLKTSLIRDLLMLSAVAYLFAWRKINRFAPRVFKSI